MKVSGVFLIAVLFSSALADKQVPQITRTDPLVVSYGRTLQLNPERHLKIVVPDKFRCEVTVVRDDPLSERTGYLMPEKFPCDFAEGEVHYVHLGSRAPSKDFVKLNVRVDSETKTLLRRLVLDITVDFSPMQIVTKNAGLVISHPGGMSNPIDEEVLHLKYNVREEGCRIIVLDSEKGLPRYGRLVNISRSVDQYARPLDCAEFLRAEIRYNHTKSSQSPNRDYIPMLVEIHRRSGELAKEHFQVAVRILGARPNQRPEPLFTPSMFMAVNQFVTKLITTDVFDATDAETNPDYLIFNVTQPLGPGEGSIISTDDPYNSITSFYRKDLKDLKIAYRPPTIMGSKTWIYKLFKVVFEAIDTEATHSEPIYVQIKVWPRNTLSPTVTKNKELLLFEGQSRIISSKDNLQISDKDNIENVQINVIGGLRHGELYVKGKLARSFTPRDLDNGTIIYQHDNSDTYSDNIILNATDGQQFVEFVFVVNIIPVDDEQPVLVHNTGLELDKHSIAIIDEYSLRATDIDSATNKLEFFVLGAQIQPSHLNTEMHKPGLQAGYLMLRQKEIPADPQNWILQSDSFYVKTKVNSFTQEDIFLRKLFYVHNGAEIFEDVFYFLLVDNADKPNASGLKTFHITINQIDIKFPEVYSECTMYVEVTNSHKVKLNRERLWFTDADSDDRKLLYTITKAPHFVPYSNKTKDAGIIVSSEKPNRVLSNFTQRQLLHHKISYKPPIKFNSFTDQLVQFTFSVSDPVGHTVENQSFIIRLHADSSQMPYRKFKLQVNEAGTLFSLGYVSYPNGKRQQQFFIVSPPAYGKLYRNGQQLDDGDSFSFGDIVNQRLLYIQDGTGGKADEIRVRLQSGRETTFQIQAASKSVHRIAPTLAKKHGPSLVKMSAISVEEGGSATVTSKVLQATDPDTDDLELFFMVNSFPKRGELLVNGKVANNFTQEDVVNGVVTYRHDMSEIGVNEVQDFFNLTLSDDSQDHFGGTRSIGFSFFVKISPVDNKKPVLNIKAPILVSEGGKTTVTTTNINVTDVDTRSEDVTCTIDAQPLFGFLENIAPSKGMEQSREGIVILSFTLEDLLLKRINYVQNDHIGNEPKRDLFALSCSDGLKTSLRHLIIINIQPENDEVPKLFRKNFSVKEGERMTITTPYLNVVDNDVPSNNLTIKVVKDPKHGVISDRSQSPSKHVTSFPFSKIREGLITYNHDGSETTQDVLGFAVSDGIHEVRKDVLVTILLVNDETPRLVTNMGLSLTGIGETRMLSSRALRADDIDSLNSNLTFILRTVPKRGQLIRYDNTGMPVNLTRGSSFSQGDIDHGMVYYTDHSVAGGRKEFRFDVTDGKNSLINQVFYIHMRPSDRIHPIVLSKGVHLRKGSYIVFDTDVISSTDPNSPDEKLEYYITKPPSKGIIEMSDQPRIPISKFTQLHLAGHKVRYVHTSSDGSNLDSFEFEVSDGRNPVMRKFRISLSDGDNTHAVVKYTRLSIFEGKTKEITSFELKAEDPDTEPALLVFSITQIPVNGFIMKHGSPTMMFTQDDIDQNLISYQHDGSDTTRDSFSFTVTDGPHLDFYVYPNTRTLTRKSQTIEIDIEAIDNKIPQIIVNRGGTTLEMRSGGDLALRITNDLLKAVDPDSNNTQLTYIVSVPPDHGAIKNVAMGNKNVIMFQQGDIDKEVIYYVLNQNSTNATEDRFYFDLTDPGKNILPSQRFSLNWAWISLDRAVYTVSETDRLIVLTLTRNGFLGEVSFVGISVEDGSATLRDDFVPNSAEQVQFSPGERFKTWAVLLIDDKLYEGLEEFSVRLKSPVMAIIGEPSKMTIRIRDPEDRPVIAVSKLTYFVEENAGLANVTLYRYGDTSKQDQVVCTTQTGTATGTRGSAIQSYSDFISRSEEKKNNVVFHQGERFKNCSVKLIDDSFYEDEEAFEVHISPSINTVVSPRYNKSTVVIKRDIRDEPRIRFHSAKYVVDENADVCKVIVRRTGSDLSRPTSVVVRSKKTNPISAKANKDYIPVSKTLYFARGVQVKKVNIVILDDLGKPVREGLEYFELALALPINGRVVMPDRTLMVINDSHSDLPKIQFKETGYTFNEGNIIVSAILVRSGDISSSSAVRCYTRQLSASAGVDYRERANSDLSVVTFQPGEKTQQCHLEIFDDPYYEGEEKLRLVLGEPKLEHGISKSVIGKRSQTIITIKDKNDRSGIGFEKKRHFVNEPRGSGENSFVTLAVIRNGDTSKISVVRLFTKDGSAKADLDFAPLSKVLLFRKNVTRIEVKIKILLDKEREVREAFTVHLSKDSNRVALIEKNKVIVYIQENLHRTGVTFPLIPTVVSLRDYDDISQSPAKPIQGYPLICVTACDPKHPRYPETGSLCARQSIDNSRTWYRWEVAAATGPDGVTNDFRSIDSETFFASSNIITLDSIYFGPGSRVRCTARAMTYKNYKGLESTSNPVTISRKEGLCLPQKMGDIGSEAFSAQITYTGSENLKYPNMIRVQVLVPHIDGMLPAISTKSLSNFEITLTADASRRGQHLCSNLLDTNEVQTKSGFLTDHVKDSHIMGGTEPYQYSSDLRGNATLRFYRNLNLEACMWTFENFYSMSELVQECGGKISTDGQVRDLTRSHLSVRVPLYVSYIYHSPSALGGWMHFDHSSHLKMSFTYDTAVLWKDGIGTPEGSVLKGYLHPTSVLIREQDKRLVVNFRTVARFTGIFITGQEDPNMVSMVMSPDQPNLSFKLKLLRSTPTYNSPEQMWQFVSEFSVRDYSGTYYIKLIPCTVTQNVKYSVPLVCNPRLPITFTLPIRFQQTSDPEAVEFNVRTQFFLLASKGVWLSNNTQEVMEQSDAAFSIGSIIYGRVMVDPQQSLGSAYHVSVEKIFVCSGLDGYIPQYDPESKEYGCLADSKQLSYRFKILDRGAPHKITLKFRNVPFDAMLAVDDFQARGLTEQPNSDGFKFDSLPLFQVSSGRQWYLHAIYTIRSSHSATRGIGKRSTIVHERSHLIHSVSKRAATNKKTEELPKGATLLRSIKLQYDVDTEEDLGLTNEGDINGQGGKPEEIKKDESSSVSLKLVLGVVVSICVILIIVVIVLVMLYRRKSPPVTTNVTVTGDKMQGTEV